MTPRPPTPNTHQEGLVGTFTQRCVVGTVHWCLPREADVKLAHVLLGLLWVDPRGEGQGEPKGVLCLSQGQQDLHSPDLA